MVTPTLRTAILKNKVAVQRVLGSIYAVQRKYIHDVDICRICIWDMFEIRMI